MVITSLTNDKVKYLTKLNNKKFREEENKFLIDGYHLVEEAYKLGLLENVIVLEEDLSFGVENIIVTKDIMKKISCLDTPPNIMGVCSMLKENISGNKFLILDGIQDPGNLGTIIRTSVAFNIDTILLSKDCVDIYHPKVIRSTQGMIFNINFKRCDLEEEINKLKDKNIHIYTTNVHNGIDIRNIDNKDKYALIMGNEGNGVSGKISSLADQNIYIKMNSKVESLNVAVATSILLYELNK